MMVKRRIRIHNIYIRIIVHMPGTHMDEREANISAIESLYCVRICVPWSAVCTLTI